jgi:hypothetical protein
MLQPRLRVTDLLPFFLLIPPMLSRYSTIFGVEPCWVPGAIQEGYVRAFRVPVFDSFLLAWVPRSLVGLAGDVLAIYLLFGSLNAKTVNFVEQTYFGGPVGVRRILVQCVRRNWSAARSHALGEAKLVLLWPRTISLIRLRTAGTRSTSRESSNEIYVSELIQRIASVAVVALLVVPPVSGLLYYVGVARCGNVGPP